MGKTISKVSLWSLGGQLLDRQSRPNVRRERDGIRCLDVHGIGEWLIHALCKYWHQAVEVIIPISHGAGVAALRGDALAFEPLDYEQDPPADVLASYRAQRDPFASTGSPALPAGLNLGTQLHWLEQLHPEAMETATLVPWAQYWAWFLSGVAVSEVTSLGCHSDLWSPAAGAFSPMTERRGWAGRFAPLVAAGDAIGTLRPELAAATGLSRSTRILAGLHDSNAALLAARGFPAIAGREATVLSTGTWFIGMRLSDEPVPLAALPEARDCLVNIDAYGRPVPSARFMGGREIETLIQLDTRQVDIKPDQPALLATVPDLLASNAMVLPTFAAGYGPYPNAQGSWRNRPDDWFAQRAAACLYAALVTDGALDLIGAKETLLVEGRFAEAEVFVRALAALRPHTSVYTAHAHNDVSFGALRLVNPALQPNDSLMQATPLPYDLTAYRSQWLAAAEAVA